MVNLTALAVIAAAVAAAVRYIYKEKKRGARCVGCPYSGTCGGSCGCNDR